jgi:hypothetical protein
LETPAVQAIRSVLTSA